MADYIAYEGQSFVIEWYFNEKEESPALEYFNELSVFQQDKTLYLFKRMGDFGKSITRRNSGMREMKYLPSNRNRTGFYAFL